MNKRIEELADKAARFSATMALPTGESGDKLFVEKFAELIVRECAQICQTVSGDQVDNASKDYQEGREMGATVCRNQIKNRFGVE